MDMGLGSAVVDSLHYYRLVSALWFRLAQSATFRYTIFRFDAILLHADLDDSVIIVGSRRLSRRVENISGRLSATARRYDRDGHVTDRGLSSPYLRITTRVGLLRPIDSGRAYPDSYGSALEPAGPISGGISAENCHSREWSGCSGGSI